jgi:hypothetical protein
VGRDYQIEFSTDLETWTDIGGLATASKDLMASEVVVPAGTAAAFFRVRETE